LIPSGNRKQLEMDPAHEPRRPLTEAEFQVALALLEGPAHGYRLMQRAGEIGNAPPLGAATMYRTLRRMLEDGLAAPAELPAGEDERRRPYRLTGEGLRAVAAEGRRMVALIGAAVVRGVPERFHTITPQLAVRDADAAIEFYRQAFGARLLARHAHQSGRVQHAELIIGDSLLLVHDDFSDLGGPAAPQPGTSGVTIHLYVADADAVFRRALDAGATILVPVADQPWGDRYGILRDPFGHRWSIGTSHQ
jgi:PhnB protein